MGGVIVLIVVMVLFFNQPETEEKTETSNPIVETEESKDVNENKEEEPRVLVHQNGSQIRVTAYGNATILEYCMDNIIKVNYLPDKLKGESAGVVGRSSWVPVEYVVEDIEANPLVMKTDAMSIAFDKIANELKIYDQDGNLILTQQAIVDTIADQVSFSHLPDQYFYGIHGFDASESSDKYLSRDKGGRVEAGQQGDSGAPLIWTNSGYGILFDSNGGMFKLKDDTIRFSKNSKKDIEYYVILGEPKDIMSGVAEISGKPPMFPKWSLGFTNSEWGINQEELVDIVDTYREKDFPIDNYTLDFDWKAWGEDNYGEFRWNNEKFPDGASGQLADDLLKQGVKLTGIMKPRILTGTTQGDYAEEHGYFYPNQKDYPEYFSGKLANDIDFSNPVARSWYFDHAKEAFDTGIIGWWNDEADELGNNLQHMNMQMALYQGQRGYSDQRVWSINRNFYLGAQRYAYALWSGDINSGFNSMANQRERMLSNMNIGQVKWGMDTGGFNGMNPTPENYTRWMQFSAFTPIFRVHSRLDQQRQPWLYGEVAEEAVREVMHLRYQLIPYMYSYERHAYETGLGLVKPLVYDYPNDPNVENIIDSWMFGDYLLVSPVVQKGQTNKEIYLPEGKWIDYFNGTVYEGGQNIQYAIDNITWSDIPLFIKEGAIIPTMEYMDYIGQKEASTIKVDVFPSNEESQFMYYEDDGQTYDYEDMGYFKQYITTKKTDDRVKVNFSPVQGLYNPEVEEYIVRIHQVTGNQLLLNGRELDIYNSMNELDSVDEGVYIEEGLYGQSYVIKIKTGEEVEIIVQ